MKYVTHFFFFCFHVEICLVHMFRFDWNSFHYFNAVVFKTVYFFRVICHYSEFLHSQIFYNLCSNTVISKVGSKAQSYIRLYSIKAFILQFVGFKFIYKSYSSAFLTKVNESTSAFCGYFFHCGVKLVSAHPSCPGKYEIILTGGIADVEAAVDHVKGRFDSRLIDSCVIGRIDPQVVTGMFGTQEGAKTGSVGIIETFSAASLIRAADIAVKTAKVAIYELRLSRGMGGKGLVIITGDVGDVTASVEAGAAYAKEQGLFCNSAVIPAPHKELWEQLS